MSVPEEGIGKPVDFSQIEDIINAQGGNDTEDKANSGADGGQDGAGAPGDEGGERAQSHDDDDRGDGQNDNEDGGDEGQDREDGGGSEGESASAEEPVTLQEVAEKLDVDVKDLYDELMIPMGRGNDPISLGDYKDRIKDLNQIDTLMTETLDREQRFYKEQAAARKEMTELLTVLPREAYTPELLQASQRIMRETAIREGSALLERIPKWQDGNVMSSEKAKIKELMTDYGYRSYEVDGIIDHRVWAILDEFQQLKEHVKLNDPEKFRERTGTKRAPRARPAKAGGLRAKLNKARQPNATESDKLDAIGGLIGGNRTSGGTTSAKPSPRRSQRSGKSSR